MADYQANGIIGWSDIENQPKRYFGSKPKLSKAEREKLSKVMLGPKQKPVQITLKKQTANGKL